jgi:hypothetical protein
MEALIRLEEGDNKAIDKVNDLFFLFLLCSSFDAH